MVAYPHIHMDPQVAWNQTPPFLYDPMISGSKQSTLFPEPGSSGKSVLYFALPRHFFLLVTPHLRVVKLTFLVCLNSDVLTGKSFSFSLHYVDSHCSGPRSGIGVL